MKLPRDLDAADLIRALARVGYHVVRQTGSHVRLECGQPQHDHDSEPPAIAGRYAVRHPRRHRTEARNRPRCTVGAPFPVRKLENPHPGEVLLQEFLLPMGISQNALARAAGVPPRRINEIVLGKRSLIADTAVRLAAAFGTTDLFWLGLQADFDLEEAHRALGRAVANIEKLTA